MSCWDEHHVDNQVEENMCSNSDLRLLSAIQKSVYTNSQTNISMF